MEAQIVPLKNTQELMQEVVDSKVTRTELLDLIVDRVKKEIHAEIDALRAEQEKLEPKTKLSLKEALKLMRYEGVETEVSYENVWREEGRTCVKISFHLNTSQLPERTRLAQAGIAALDKRIQETKGKAWNLENGKGRARLAMVQESLSSTPEGKRILNAIDGLKEVVKARLLAAGDT